MKNQPDQSDADLPSWGGGPKVQAEDTVEDGADTLGKGPGTNANSIGQGSCYDCQVG
jgi:hypothetical protein